MSKGRILFMGTPEFAVASLDALVNAGFEVAAVVTAPDRPAGRSRQLRTSAVKDHALRLGIPVLQPERLRDPAFHAELDRLAASLYVVVAFRMLPESVWARPPLGTINLHASLLPDYRGAAPINWALINGEERTGITTFKLGHAIDTGDILLAEELPIGPEDDAGALHDRLMARGALLLVRTVEGLFAGTVIARPQGGGGHHEAPKLTPLNCRIQWNSPSRQVHNLVRGLSPYPGAWTHWLADDKPPEHFKVIHARITNEDAPSVPGAVRIEQGRLLVRAQDGWLDILELQPEGRKRMDAASFVRGLRSRDNIRFE
ncbi:MAG: methionyl-tRNA formyltransferase [Flavobacteriales bacterium]|nr:methionyl-tRNA formyltransferase [Flavobacteriales bacterium]